MIGAVATATGVVSADLSGERLVLAVCSGLGAAELGTSTSSVSAALAPSEVVAMQVGSAELHVVDTGRALRPATNV